MREIISILMLTGGFALCVCAGTLKAADSGAVNPKALAGQILRAGPVRMKFEDGQIRYLYVGDKEIIRRVYFGVRDENWGTAPPVFTRCDVEKADDHFTVNLAANCKMNQVDISWTGVITGTADGKITFQVTATPNADFQSNRISLCVLSGVHSLAGQVFETDGKTEKSEFPRLVSPKLVGEQYHKLQYTTKEGLKVSVQLDGAIFDMEDQRNWGDTSWKAYAPLPYAYKQIKKGDTKTETVTITVGGTIDAKASPQEPVHLKLGQEVPNARIPTITPVPQGKIPEFTEISFHHDKYKDAKSIEWSYIPTTHLPDADTIMENMSAVMYQAKTVHAFNPGCTIHIGPLGLSNAGVKDDRANTQLAAAWATGVVRFLALGGVDEASFAVGDGAPKEALDAIKPFEKQPLINVETKPVYSHHIVPFATQNEKTTAIFLVNRTDHVSHAELALSAKKANVLHIGSGASEQAVEAAGGSIQIELAPFDVVRVTIAK